MLQEFCVALRAISDLCWHVPKACSMERLGNPHGVRIQAIEMFAFDEGSTIVP
jgi:hypothetical protein